MALFCRKFSDSGDVSAAGRYLLGTYRASSGAPRKRHPTLSSWFCAEQKRPCPMGPTCKVPARPPAPHRRS